MEFVPERSVDFVYIEKTYYLGPDKGGERAYRLLSDALTRTGLERRCKKTFPLHSRKGGSILASMNPIHH